MLYEKSLKKLIKINIMAVKKAIGAKKISRGIKNSFEDIKSNLDISKLSLADKDELINELDKIEKLALKMKADLSS